MMLRHVKRRIQITESALRLPLTKNARIAACVALFTKYGSRQAVADALGWPRSKVDRLVPRLKE